MKIKKRLILKFFFIFLQPFVIFLFFNYGHDTQQYILFTKGIGEDYLELSWRMIFLLFSDYKLKIYIMLIFLIFPSYMLFSYLINYTCSFWKQVGILLLILSYEISGVAGALRQEIIVLFFALFLITYNYFYYILSLIFHWIGILYVFFNKYWKLIILISVFILLFFFQSYYKSLNIYSRILFYLSNPFNMDIVVVLNIVFYKFLLFIIFLLNKDVLNKLFILNKIKLLKNFFLMSPLLQIMIFLITASPQIFQRLGMVFDPFIIIFMSLIILFKNNFFMLLTLLLIFFKFFARLYALF